MSQEQLKIGIVTETDLKKKSGVGEYVEGLRQFLEDKVEEVCLITPENLGWRVDLTRPLRMIGYSAPVAWTGARQEKIREYFEQENFSLVHLTAPFGDWGRKILKEAQEQKIAKVATFLIYRERNMIEDYGLRLYLGKSVANLDARIALSEAAKKFAQRVFGGEYEVIYGGVDLECFHPEGPKLKGYSDGKYNLGFLGRFDWRKGAKYALRAFSIINKSLSKTRLLIGGRGPEERKLRRLTKNLGLEKDVVFLGYVSEENHPKFLQTIDVLLVPSIKEEALGYVILEAIASGKPVIASDIPGYREVKGPLFVPPGDAQALAETTLNLLEDESLRQDCAQKSLEAAQGYSWEIVGEQILDVYHQVI